MQKFTFEEGFVKNLAAKWLYHNWRPFAQKQDGGSPFEVQKDVKNLLQSAWKTIKTDSQAITSKVFQTKYFF